MEHEILFGLFLLVTWLRLVGKAGPLHLFSLLFLGCILGGIAVAVWAQRRPSPFRWRIRLLYYPSVMGISFFLLAKVIPLLGSPGADGFLLGLDRACLGETPALAYQAWDHPGLNDLLMVAYLFFFYYLVLGPAYYCIYDLAKFRQCIVGLFALYGVGFFLYTVVPAGGPHLHLKFTKPLEGWWVIPHTLGIINGASNGADVFPSLHFAASFYLLMFDWQHRRRHFWWCLWPCVALWCSTVLLRFHYFVDLVGGLGIAVFGLIVVRWHVRRVEGEGGAAGPSLRK